MNEPERALSTDLDIKDRPSRARYDKVKHALDVKWRRRELQPERMMREVIDGLWDAFGGSPWSWCGVWLPQPDGMAFHPGAARPAPAAAVPAAGALKEALTAGLSRREGGVIAVPILDKDGRPWAVFEAKSSSPFDDMDARWLERLFKAFQDVERPERPLP